VRGRNEVIGLGSHGTAERTRDRRSQLRRISRRKNRLVAMVGSYVVTGTAHTQPGTTLDPYVLRRQVRFLPLTDAWVTHRTDPTVELMRPVLIVNTMNLIELRQAMTVV
jgi:hypothetical protein